MSRPGREIAIHHGQNRPLFATHEAAETAVFSCRDRHLARLSDLAEGYPGFEQDHRPDGVMALERWNFPHSQNGILRRIGVTRHALTFCMGLHSREAVVRNSTASSVVWECFLAKGRLELGIRIGSMKMMLDRLTDHFAEPNSLRRESLYSRNSKYFPG